MNNAESCFQGSSQCGEALSDVATLSWGVPFLGVALTWDGSGLCPALPPALPHLLPWGGRGRPGTGILLSLPAAWGWAICRW